MYGVLPSVIKSQGTTYDIKVTEALMDWEQKMYDEANGIPAKPNLTQEQMKAMIKQVKGAKK